MSRFIVSWDQLGLECIWDIGAAEENITFETLQGKDGVWRRNIGNQLNGMMLRARVNPQRHYEIYLIETTDDIGQSDLETLFEESPQTAADLIRERGVKIFSDRAPPDSIKIR